MTTHGDDSSVTGREGTRTRNRIYRIKPHILPFTDHSNTQSLLLFEGRESCPLPPLYTFSLYFTHKTANTTTIHPLDLFTAIRRGTPLQHYPCPFRLEFSFLSTPSAPTSDETCISHYRAEKQHRGDYTAQLASRTPGSSPTGLPGFVPSYIDNTSFEFYHGLLFIYQGAGWRTEKEAMRCDSFDPISQDEYDGVGEEGEEEVLEGVEIVNQVDRRCFDVGVFIFQLYIRYCP
ncbi:hypothetical protein COCCADRAFT_102695 [Bipolaris zeicola 26-R-13]|uniref:Uncharacterized protein n=1 Tax=Cochliobolus carbonum (strain 26-R-13) TaxID=930089 RepID=W6XYU5_COCC2|nr:uncharacterized protein COCCADRAFT_102695 [Bipolaris zeicola 26-R-13]EUC30908.1 hypothetical protein COCCADRAFT_102695 [Bipolaris zeicola 26-R-13]